MHTVVVTTLQIPGAVARAQLVCAATVIMLVAPGLVKLPILQHKFKKLQISILCDQGWIEVGTASQSHRVQRT